MEVYDHISYDDKSVKGKASYVHIYHFFRQCILRPGNSLKKVKFHNKTALLNIGQYLLL